MVVTGMLGLPAPHGPGPPPPTTAYILSTLTLPRYPAKAVRLFRSTSNKLAQPPPRRLPSHPPASTNTTATYLYKPLLPPTFEELPPPILPTSRIHKRWPRYHSREQVEHESYNDGSSSRPPWSRGRSFHRETQRSRRHARSTSRESTAATAALSDTEPDDYGCNARLSAGRLHATASLDSVASVSVSSPSAGLLSPSSAAGNTTRLVSNHNNNNDVYLHQQRRKSSSSPSAPGRVTSWALSLDKLLTDPVGLHVFTEFLTKEFSKENIIFWTACESFRRLTSENEMRQEAAGIFQRHLCPTGENPVNVDSKVRQDTERLLTQPHQTMFDAAQRQIYQLMRYDSYTRFIRSDSYQELVKKEMSGKIITLITDTNEKVIQDVSSGRSGGGSRHHLGDSGTEEPRRRSLLPWIGRSKKLNTLLGHVFPNAPYSTTHGFTSYNPTQHLQHATKALDS